MNKKISTLFAVSLLMVGALGSKASAEQINKLVKSAAATEVDGNASYVLVQDFSGTKYVYGFELQDDGTLKQIVKKFDADVKPEELKDFMWKISEQQNQFNKAQYSYSFSNVGANGAALRVNQETDGAKVEVVTDTSVEDAKTYKSFVFNGIKKYNGNSGTLSAYIDGKTWNLFRYDEGLQKLAFTGGDHTKAITFYEVIDSNAGDVTLNALYNKKGFNFTTVDENVESNLFDSETPIYAVYVDKEYEVSTVNANGKKLTIPVGTYFFTNRVLNKNAQADANGQYKAKDIDWLASELIMVSPKETVETTVPDRKAGQGFKLVPVKGDEFIFQENISKYKVADMPIHNACFEAKFNNVDKYALRLNDFYYQQNSTDGADKALVKGTVEVAVLPFTDGTKHLATVEQNSSKSYQYAFTLSDSSVKDGKELLKNTKEAAVYNIQFVAGNKEDKELVGKYLTNGVETTGDEKVASGAKGFTWVAKGTDIAKLNYPAFQYTITAVEKEDGKKNDDKAKYVNVTFTNRETDESFTAKLFPEKSAGENCYSISFVKGSMSVQPVDVKSNGYGVIKNPNAPIAIDQDVIIKLIPAEVDEHAGFLNVADKSLRTIRYARDKFDTSNMWYTAAKKEDGTNVYRLTEDGSADGDDYFVEDIYDAAQFQLIKADSSTIARTFVYNNETTKDVDNVVNGDKLTAYQYKMRYINDGSETDYYLYTKNQQAALVTENEVKNFYVKENADGSVSFMAIDNAFEKNSNKRQATPANTITFIDAEVSPKGVASYLSGNNRAAIYAYTSSDQNFKTYLDANVPNVSWKAAEGHVTLRNISNGVVGNYIDMKENKGINEGIVVSDNNSVLYLNVTDKEAVVPSFYISKTIEGDKAERMFLFNPVDSVKYPVNMDYDPNYQLDKEATKVIFKAGALNETSDQLTTTVKGEKRALAMEADNEGVWGGLNRFKFQIIENAEGDGYNIRQINGAKATKDAKETTETVYLASLNEKLYLTKNKAFAMNIEVKSVDAPTANESIADATEAVKVIAGNGTVTVQGAAGKQVTISNVLGKVIASTILTSDNATFNAPAGIAVVAVEGEAATKVVVK